MEEAGTFPGFLLPPMPEDWDWAWEALADLRIRWWDPDPVVLRALAEELAARRATARLRGPEEAGLIARASPKRVTHGMPGPYWRIRAEQPLGGLAVLLGLAVPKARDGNDRPIDAERLLQSGRGFRERVGAINEILIPGRDGVARLEPVARRIGMEIRPEEPGRQVQEEIRAIQQDMARLVWMVHQLPALPPEEIEGVAASLEERAWKIREQLHFLQAWGALEVEVEAMAVLAHLGLLPGEENVRAARVSISRSRLREQIQTRHALRGVVRLGLTRVWVGRDGKVLPLDRVRRPVDVALLREEADRLEELAQAYRARARELRGEGKAGGTMAGPVRYRAGRHAE